MNENLKILQRQKEGIRLAEANSDNLFNSAELLSGNGYYSPAIPLLILSAEEIIKSLALCLESLLGSNSEVKNIIPNSKNKAVDSYLFDHEDKHKLAKAIIVDIRKLAPWMGVVQLLLPKLMKYFDFFSLSPDQINEIDKLMIDFESFNNIKNKGLYVDRLNSGWTTPLMFNLSDYKNYSEKIVLIRKIFSDRINYFLGFPDSDLCLLIDAFNED
jgi:AbiV family abortive infection protein